MRKSYLLLVLLLLALAGCSANAPGNGEKPPAASPGAQPPGLTEAGGESAESEAGYGYMLYIKTGDSVLQAELEENSSSAALVDLLNKGDLTIQMSDYGDFEKVGNLGATLPRNDERISTEAGDLILYQGDKFAVYYDTNTWDFTKLGKINNASRDELKAILGEGDVSVTLSVQK